MSVLVIGSNGSMGKRYKAILQSLHVPYYGVDVEHSFEEIINAAKAQYTHAIIIASPTDTHKQYLTHFASLKKPVLCEKPIIKDSKEVARILKLYEENDTPFTMMMQYSELVNDNSQGDSFYDYFRSGPDGLYWDCLQIIGLAKSTFWLAAKSPIWNCMINGKRLSIADMDKAYVSFVNKWLNGEIKQSTNNLVEMHKQVEKCHESISSRSESFDRNPSQVYQ